MGTPQEFTEALDGIVALGSKEPTEQERLRQILFHGRRDGVDVGVRDLELLVKLIEREWAHTLERRTSVRVGTLYITDDRAAELRLPLRIKLPTVEEV